MGAPDSAMPELEDVIVVEDQYEPYGLAWKLGTRCELLATVDTELFASH